MYVRWSFSVSKHISRETKANNEDMNMRMNEEIHGCLKPALKYRKRILKIEEILHGKR